MLKLTLPWMESGRQESINTNLHVCLNFLNSRKILQYTHTRLISRVYLLYGRLISVCFILAAPFRQRTSQLKFAQLIIANSTCGWVETVKTRVCDAFVFCELCEWEQKKIWIISYFCADSVFLSLVLWQSWFYRMLWFPRYWSLSALRLTL